MGKKRVELACRDCQRCTNSSFANAGRVSGRALAALSTGGMSEIGFALRKKCRQCGHQMSLHHGAAAMTPQPAVSVVQPDAPGPRRPSSIAADLDDLADLHARGVLSDEEFDAAKRRVLDT